MRPTHRQALRIWHPHGERPGPAGEMLIARTLFALLAVAAILCFAMYAGTGQRRWLRLGWLIVKWTIVAGLGFFAVLILERLILML